MRFVVSGSLLAAFAVWAFTQAWQQRRKDRETQRRFNALQLHRIAGRHPQERYDSLARLIRERTGK